VLIVLQLVAAPAAHIPLTKQPPNPTTNKQKNQTKQRRRRRQAVLVHVAIDGGV
jgi:hypothetical protein